MKLLANVILLSFALFYYSCDRQHPTLSGSECVDQNNKGAELIAKYQQGQVSDLTKAISFFKEAIKCNPRYTMAYTNLALAYDYKKNYKEELSVYSKILSFTNNDPFMLTEKGIVFEKLNQIDSAKIAYQLALQGFKNKLTAKPANVNNIEGLLMILALTEGKKSALRELDKQVASNPELAHKMASEYYFYQNFDKLSYIYHLSQ